MKLNTIAGIRSNSLRLFLLVIFLSTIPVHGQSKTNLEIFFSQIDSAGREILSNISDKNTLLKINFLAGSEYSILENRLTSFLIKNGLKISLDENSSLKLNFAITETSVKYNDSFRDGLFGDILVERTVVLNGNYLIPEQNLSKDFSYLSTDTIKYEQLNEIENRAYPFTQNNHPSEPFISSLIEPVIAVGAAATAVILFFTIRSK
ncbi:MAG: hypothetical protein ACUVRG_06305 [Ignavibacterium sp.]|uniref:hypothetical protein n=1 Tax=Ignavibacterium sp. TaxID=2651167 RepID=UPI0040492DD3